MDSNNPAHEAAERIRKAVPILQVLTSYGYHVRPEGGDREQQFSCDLHGDGRDSMPSARVYPVSNSWFCFACNKTRDAVETVRAKENLTFWQAVKKLERAFGLTPFEWTPKPIEDEHAGIRAILDPARTFEQDAERVRGNLATLTDDRQLPMETTLAFWEGFDKIVFRVRGPKGEGGEWSESKGREMMLTLNEHINETVRAFLSGSG